MNVQNDLRLSKKSSEILSNLVRLSLRFGHGILWQNIPRSKKRTIWPTILEKVDLENRMIILNLYPDANIPIGEEPCLDFSKVNITEPLYFKGSNREILFKVDEGDFFFHEGRLMVKIPLSAFFKENRGAPRLTPKELLSLGIHTGRGGQSMNLGCKNFAPGGVGVTLSFSNAHLFKKGQRLLINRFGEYVLPKDLLAEVKYVRRYHEEKERKILMGLSYITPLKPQFYQKISDLFH